MHRDYFVRIGLSALFGVVAVVGLPAVAQPPPLDITEPSIAGGLNSQQVSRIDEWLDWWKSKIVNAAGNSGPKDVIAARNGILRHDYILVPTSAYQDEYAARAVVKLTPLLTGGLKADDKLLRFKQVNVGLVLSKMPQFSIRRALEVLVRSPNAAVRYLGWKGYHSVRTRVLAQGPSYVKT